MTLKYDKFVLVLMSRYKDMDPEVVGVFENLKSARAGLVEAEETFRAACHPDESLEPVDVLAERLTLRTSVDQGEYMGLPKRSYWLSRFPVMRLEDEHGA